MTIQEHLDVVSKILLVALLVPAIDAQCVQTTSAAGAIGDTVHFYICDTPNPGNEKAPPAITITSKDKDVHPYISDLTILKGTTPTQAGWFWEIVTSVTGTYFHISFLIESENNFASYEVEYFVLMGDNKWEKRKKTLTVRQAAILDAHCVETTTTAGAIGDTVHFHICDTPFPGTELASPYVTVTSNVLGFHWYIDGLKIVNGTTQAGWFWQIVTSDSGTYFYISFMIKSEIDFVTYEVSYDVYQPDGKWMVKNTHLTVNHAGPPQPCDDQYRTARPIVVELSTNISSWGSSSICFVSQSGSQLTSTKDVSTGCNMSSKDTPTFSEQVLHYQPQPAVHELLVEVASLSYADLGTWIINVTNGEGTLEVYITVKATDFTCSEETQEESEGDGEGDGITFIIVGVCSGLLLVTGIVACILYRKKARSTPPDVLMGTAEQNQRLNKSSDGTRTGQGVSNRKANKRKDQKGNSSGDGDHGNGNEDEEEVIANPVYESSSSALVTQQGQGHEGQPNLQGDEIVIANPVYGTSST